MVDKHFLWSTQLDSPFLTKKKDGRRTRRQGKAHQRAQSVDWVRFCELLLRHRRYRDVSPFSFECLCRSGSVAWKDEAANVFESGGRVQREMYGVSRWRGEFAVFGYVERMVSLALYAVFGVVETLSELEQRVLMSNAYSNNFVRFVKKEERLRDIFVYLLRAMQTLTRFFSFKQVQERTEKTAKMWKSFAYPVGSVHPRSRL